MFAGPGVNPEFEAFTPLEFFVLQLHESKQFFIRMQQNISIEKL